MLLAWLTFAALVVTAITAVLLARRNGDYWPVAAFLCAVLGANTLRVPLLPFQSAGGPPFVGLPRVALHANEALYLVWDAALVVAVIFVFLSRERRRWFLPLPVLAWAGETIYLVIRYPVDANDAVRDVYGLTDVAAVIVGIGAAVLWTWRRLSPTPAHVALAGILMAQLITVVGGSLKYGLWEYYYLDQFVSIFMYVALTIYQVSLWRSRSLPR